MTAEEEKELIKWIKEIHERTSKMDAELQRIRVLMKIKGDK